MDSNSITTSSDSRLAAVVHLKAALAEGRDWPEALLEAMALWTAPEEVHGGRSYNYLIAGEVFDWLLLAERLLEETSNAVPQDEMETLLFEGRFPDRFDTERIQELLGGEKYRGYLNYHYGVTVEEALQLACELELRKRDTSNGVRYRTAYSEQAFPLIYRKSREELLQMFRDSEDLDHRDISSMAEHRAFTYWLFKYRWANSDKARIASDTTKGLRQLERMESAIRRKQGAAIPATT
jgi:hypothetical protein